MMLEIKNVQKKYDHFQLNCTLNIQEGAITGLIGQNGAGKTTLFKAILGLIHIDGGTIQIPPKEEIGVVLADAGFSDYLTIGEIISILENMYMHFEKDYFIQKCDEFNLPRDKKILDFSTGMKAKLKVLIALTHHAQLLILDEPTSGLDVIARDDILNMIREFMEENPQHTVLISSHISSDLESLCDDVYMINDGAIVLHETIDDLLNQYALLKVDDQQYQNLDKEYLLKIKKESYGYCCLTNQKQFYQDNYPDIVIDKNNIDELFFMMIRGE